MSYAYQPAERMYLVLQDVLTELRGTPMHPHSIMQMDMSPSSLRTPYSNSFRNDRLVPSRRDSSSMDDMNSDAAFTSFAPTSKRRAIAHPASLSSGGGIDMHIDPMLASLSTTSSSSAARRKASNTSDADRPESFVLVTPRSEYASWTTTFDTTSIAPSSLSAPTNASAGVTSWMLSGTGDIDTQDVSHLATVHFPELRDLPTMGENGSPVAVPNLDFLSFGSGEEWRDWGVSTDGMGDGGFGTGIA
jgi:hypothetical protein